MDQRMFSIKMRSFLFLFMFLANTNAIESSPSEISSPIQRQFQKEMLEMHNYFRRLHCLLTLKLDDKLCQSALDYAKQLAKIGKLVHSKNNDNYGENLFKLTSSKSIQTIDGGKVTRAWYNEINDYDFQKPVISSKTGHFTQLIWNDSKRLGVGFALSEDEHTIFVVAHYVAPGNIKQELTQNVLPPHCS